MLQQNIDTITSEHINALITDAVPESIHLDYKQVLPLGNDDGKKELLADVSSFANSNGGHLIYGISELVNSEGVKTGLPDKVIGLDEATLDQEILRIEGTLRDCLSPRINGIRIKRVAGFSEGPILIIHIPQSWGSPHMVTFKGSSRFFARNNAGKFPLDVNQLRSAFLFSDSIAEKIKNIRLDRIARISVGDTPMPLEGKRKIIVHIIPLSSFRSRALLNITEMEKHPNTISPLTSTGGFGTRVNLDGLVSFFRFEKTGPCVSYTQFFQDGIIEAVDSYTLNATHSDKIPIAYAEKQILDAVSKYIKFLSNLGVSGPAVIMLTLIGVKGLNFEGKEILESFVGKTPIDRDPLLLPDALLQDFEVNIDHTLRPIFDALHNSAGFHKCNHFDKNGNWSDKG